MATAQAHRSRHTVSTVGPLSFYSTSYSSESKTLCVAYSEAVDHYTEPVTAPRSVHHKFYDLFYAWKYDTLTVSSPTEIAMHPAYQEIIGMGQSALPYILKELLDEPDYWFWALKAISGLDPVRAEERGNIQRMRLRWLIWANENGYI